MEWQPQHRRRRQKRYKRRAPAGPRVPQAFALSYRPTMLAESPPSRSLDTALELHRKALRLVPLAGKRALIKDWPSLHLGESEIRDWAERGVNWGIITGEPLIILDTDSEEAEAWVQRHGIESPVVVRTGGGGLHRYFRCGDGVEVHSRSAAHGIDGLDVKGWRSYVVAPGAMHPETSRRYEFVPGKELGELSALPVFDRAWVRERSQPQTRRPNGFGAPQRLTGRIRDIRAYIRGIPSIEGQGGDKACFTVACLLVEAGFDYAAALTELEAWNQECAFGPWSTKALEHKLRSAFKRVLGVKVSGRR